MKRQAILSGTARAAEFHRELGLRDQLRSGDRPIDVIEALHLAGLVILFKRLQGLLGAYVPSTAASGVLITTERNLHIQRLTGAHELGHHILGHRALSLDAESDIGFIARGEKQLDKHDPQEIEADAFAMEFMLPSWLIVSHARKQGWGKRDLCRPEIAYQLSLRLGASYAATCWALVNNSIVPRASAQGLWKATPKSSKQKAIPDIVPPDWRADVWELSEADRGNQILGNPEDFLVLTLNEHVSSGYAWDSSQLAEAGLSVQKDERRASTDQRMGGTVARRLVVQGEAVGKLRLHETRPWESEAAGINDFELELALVGAQTEGLPRFLPRRAA